MDQNTTSFLLFLLFAVGIGFLGLLLVHSSENSRRWYPRSGFRHVLTVRQFERYANWMGMLFLLASLGLLMLPLVVGFV